MKKKSVFLAVVMACLTLIITGCGEDDKDKSWNCVEYGATQQEPLYGLWILHGWNGDEEVNVAFTVFLDSDGLIRIKLDNPVKNYLRHQMYVNQGAFSYFFGQIGGTHCPIDSFCFSGQFTSEKTAQGMICEAFACQETVQWKWEAEWQEP
jgi:hypothetical protein